MTAHALPDPQAGARAARIQMEAAYALKGVSKRELLDCLAQVPGVAGKGFMRRGKSLVRAVRKAGQMAATECANALSSVRGNRLGDYVGRKRAAVQGAGGAAAAWFRKAPQLWSSLRERPQEILPELIGGLLGFWIGSGGLDGNGGLPDLDLQIDLGAHRSPLTHSIIMGVTAETALVFLLKIVGLLHSHLPAEHDPMWDQVHDCVRRGVGAAGLATALGLAYHLGVDATVQPAPYHDLPFSMPMEGHQATMAINAAAEAAGAKKPEVGAQEFIS